MDYFARLRKDLDRIAPQGVLAELLKLVPATQVMHGSDFPYVPTGTQQQQLAQLGLDAAQLDGIRSENAIRLIPRLEG